jgi:heavy metal sensor kinase
VNQNSLRYRVTAYYVALLALALVTFSVAVYLGVQAFITRSLEHSLIMNASTILTDYVKPLDAKGESWFQNEMSESYPAGVSDTFVRVSRGQTILYETGEMRDFQVAGSALSTMYDQGSGELNRERTKAGQKLITYTLPYRTPRGDLIVIQTGATTEPIRHVLRSLFLILLTGTPIILVAAALGGYVLMARALRPVVTLTEQAERVGRDDDLGERLPVIPSGDELERLSLSLNRMIERLEETVAHNRRFSADASHELRTPLTVIRGELEVLIQNPTLPAVFVEGIGSALEESNRMSHIVESLMTISRLEAGSEQMTMTPVDLAMLASKTLEQMSLLADEKEINLTCNTSGPVHVTGDAMRLKQVVANLLDNAIKYTANKGRVVMSVSAEADLAVLQVSDTGIGIPLAAIPLVFERFYRADETRSRESGGIGLGLAIVKSICTAHRGTVSLSSAEGRGTTLRVELPLLHGWNEVRATEEVVAGPLHTQQASAENGLRTHEKNPSVSVR